MKYLVIIESSVGIGNATIFDTLEAAKNHLKKIASSLKYPLQAEWENDEYLIIKAAHNNWTKAYIVKTDRAEYRLVRHVRGKKDEERRFSIRNNAIKFIAEDTATTEDDLKNEYLYKLYAVILEPEQGSSKVLRRFSAANSLDFIYGDTEEYTEETPADENAPREAVVIEKIHEPFIERIVKKTKLNNRKKLYAVIAAIVIITAVGINVLTTDWQLIADERKASQFSASGEVKAIADSLSFTRKGKAVFFASQPKLLGSTDFNKTCGKDGSKTFTSGCYYKDTTDDEHIEIYNVGTSTINENGLSYDFAEYRKSVTLHETLHAVWARQNEGRKNSICSDLKVLSNQISALKQEISLYSSDKLCTELFARVGSEYVPILSPNNNIPSSADIPIKYSSLDASGKTAVSNLVKVYDEYFDTKKFNWVINYWKSENSLSAFETKIVNYSNNLSNKERSTRALINQYYYWPTWSRYYAANNAISEYNKMLATFKSYANTYNKVYSKLDSEHTMSSGGYLSL